MIKYVAIAITGDGSNVHWTAGAIMVYSTLVFTGLALTKPRSCRIFHSMTAAITLIASIAYFSMISSLGWAPIVVGFRFSNPIACGINREVFTSDTSTGKF